MYGRFKEAVDGSVVWDDIDEKTFTSFWQYVYTGNYDIPEPLITTDQDQKETDKLNALEPPPPLPEPEPELPADDDH